MLEEEEEDYLTCKVVLIGESGVGKTSIIQRYINNTFTPGIPTTGGANFTTKTMKFEEENQKIKFEIWDTAGQEKFRSLAKVFYKNAAVCILVYDITRKESFEELENFWVEEIQNSACSDICKIIIYIFSYSIGYCWE
jgi:small GTP-binding protein